MISGGLFCVVIGACFPIWRAWQVSSFCAYGRLTTLWDAATAMLRPEDDIDHVAWVFSWHWENWLLLLGLFNGGAWVGWWLARKCRRLPNTSP
jgi:hypothetical protein